MKHIPTFAAASLIATTAHAGVLKTVEVEKDVYAIVGPMTQRDKENFGNNATFGLIVTRDGAILMDPGGSYLGAKQLDEAVKTLTDQPVKYVVDMGGQDHRWLGNGYWQEHGAQVIASQAAVEDQHDRASEQLSVLLFLLGEDGVAGTEPADPDITFETDYTLTLGDVSVQLHHEAGAHTPGDSTVWYADKSVLFAGDIVFMERILGISPHSNTMEWVQSFEALAALNPAHIVPGHGDPTDLAGATHDTYDYLVNIRTKMAEHIENGGDAIGSVKIDQSAFSYLKNFDLLAGKNAQETYIQMEWE